MGYAEKLKSDSIFIRDEKVFDEKVEQMKQDGLKSLQAVFDFDATISKAFHNGKQAQSCHDCMENILSQEINSYCKALNVKYLKIEFDPSISVDDKLPHMEEWWTLSHNKIIEGNIHKDQIEDAVSLSRLILREREGDLFELYREENIPILLFSAGIADIVQAAMTTKATSGFTENMKVISNKMIFNSDRILCGFSEPLIHTFSKTPRSIGNEWLKTLKERKNVILMGDSHGDPHMVSDDDLESGVCLRIGFLNRQIEENILFYQEIYDIVLVQDETMNVPIEITKMIFNN